jgi:Flp pilus assembly protein TadG
LKSIAARRACRDQRRQPPKRQGAALVEFALVAPLLFTMIVLPIFEFSRGMMVSELLTNAARAGARVGILPGNSNSAVTAAVNANLSAQEISGVTTTITVNGAATDVGSASSGDAIAVTVTIPFNSISWVPGNYLSGLTLSGSQTLRHE